MLTYIRCRVWPAPHSSSFFGFVTVPALIILVIGNELSWPHPCGGLRNKSSWVMSPALRKTKKKTLGWLTPLGVIIWLQIQQTWKVIKTQKLFWRKLSNRAQWRTLIWKKKLLNWMPLKLMLFHLITNSHFTMFTFSFSVFTFSSTKLIYFLPHSCPFTSVFSELSQYSMTICWVNDWMDLRLKHLYLARFLSYLFQLSIFSVL